MLLLTGQVPMTSQVKPLYQTLLNCEALVTFWFSEIHFIHWASFILFISQLKCNLAPLFFSLQILKIEVILLLSSRLNFNYFKNIWIFFLLNLLQSCSMCVCTYIHAGSFSPLSSVSKVVLWYNTRVTHYICKIRKVYIQL